MLYYVLKLFVSALLVVVISEAAKRYSLLGALIASLPLISILAICWLYWETGNIDKVSSLSIGIFYLVLPSLIFFITLPLLLRQHYHFYLALSLAASITVVAYVLLWWLLTKVGVRF